MEAASEEHAAAHEMDMPHIHVALVVAGSGEHEAAHELQLPHIHVAAAAAGAGAAGLAQ